MAKTIFEEMGGTYTQVGDYLLPDLKLPEEEQQSIGVWGQRHRRYLKEHRRAAYATLLTSGKLNGYLADSRGGRCHGATQGRPPNGVGLQDE